MEQEEHCLNILFRSMIELLKVGSAIIIEYNNVFYVVSHIIKNSFSSEIDIKPIEEYNIYGDFKHGDVVNLGVSSDVLN